VPLLERFDSHDALERMQLFAERAQITANGSMYTMFCNIQVLITRRSSALSYTRVGALQRARIAK
jgi:hypothetical protein